MAVAINDGINNKIGSSNSGVTNTLTIDNASNTASSQSLLNITVGGGTAGDALQTFTVSGVTNWSQGVDNSDSDAYVLAASTALGTTNVVRAQTTGEINYPLQTAFLAQLASSALNVLGNITTPYLVVFDTEVFDQNSDFNSSTGTFTAPVTGRYLISFGGNLQQVTGTMNNFDVRLVASNRTCLGTSFNAVLASTVAGTSGLVTGVQTYLMDMDAADISNAEILLSGGAGATADVIGGTSGSFYSGFLAC